MTAPKSALLYAPFPRQREFHESKAKYRLFGGAAGPGKTKALLWEAIRQALALPGVNTLLMRRTFAELEKTLIRQFRLDVPHEMYRSFNDSKHIVTWHNGSTTQFGYSAGENDVYQYQGAEMQFIGIDELTLFTLGQWQFLTSRNRCAVRGSRPCMAAASNPGNIGHAWVKAMWIDRKAPAGVDDPSKYDPSEYEFIRALISDNPIYKDDVSYLKTLDSLPRDLRRAMLEGDWNLFAGQYFDIFDRSKHVVSSADIAASDEPWCIRPWWTRWISVDWGFEHPAAAYWNAMGPDGHVVTYREWVQNHLSPKMLAQGIVERCEGEKIGAVYLSPDAFARRTSEATIADQMSDVFAVSGLPPPTDADNDRIGGWMLMYQLLESERWLISNQCVRLIECIPALTRDPKRIEDVLKMSGDDPADAARYGLKSRLAPGRVPLAQRVMERVGMVTDPTSRAIRMQQALIAEQKKEAPIRRGPSRRRPTSQQRDRF